MSACISRRGEYSSHEPNAEYVCEWCGVFDEDSLTAELRRLRLLADAVESWRDQCEAFKANHDALIVAFGRYEATP